MSRNAWQSQRGTTDHCISANNLTQPIQRNTQGPLTTLEDQDGFSLGLQLSWRAGG